MTYADTLRYLDSFVNYEKKTRFAYKQSFKLERIKEFLRGIGNPQDELHCVHVAGTKGKGSTCMFIASILREAGFSVGLYTSPHLSSVRERIRILRPRGYAAREDFEGMITKQELTRLVKRLQQAISSHNRDSVYGPLSFFEVYTVMAFCYFKEQGADIVVLETGLGGRLDATNVVDARVSCLTPISFDHMQKLGSTLAEIAREKAGIIKPRRRRRAAPVVCAPQRRDALSVIRARCQRTRAHLSLVGRDIICQGRSRWFSLKTPLGRYPGLKTKLIGEHQLVNAAVAVGAAEALSAQGMKVTASHIRTGISRACWPGRCEVVGRKPWVVLDGAQNVDSCRVIKEAVQRNFRYNKLILVLGISNDKDVRGICACLASCADTVILTRSSNPRACLPEQLAHYFSQGCPVITHSVSQAHKAAYLRAGSGDLILVCGSLFVVGEFRELV